MIAEDQAETPMRFEVRQYRDSVGHQIGEHVPTAGGASKYFGQAIGKLQVNGKDVSWPFGFPIEAGSVDAAFDALDATAAKVWPQELERAKAQFREQAKHKPKVVVPKGRLGRRHFHPPKAN